MAHKSCSLLLAFFFLTTLSLEAHSTMLAVPEGAEVHVQGRVRCSLTGNPEPRSRPLAGVNVSLSCDGGQTSLAGALTDPAGVYNATLSSADGLLLDLSECSVHVNASSIVKSNCTLSLPTGVPGALITLVRVALSINGVVSLQLTADIIL